jgi:class 3 adenylate cyclase
MDPEAWTGIMKAAFGYLIEPVERYGGTVARLMGDAILAFFGAPTAWITLVQPSSCLTVPGSARWT